jgi:hypothetical protein
VNRILAGTGAAIRKTEIVGRQDATTTTTVMAADRILPFSGTPCAYTERTTATRGEPPDERLR